MIVVVDAKVYMWAYILSDAKDISERSSLDWYDEYMNIPHALRKSKIIMYTTSGSLDSYYKKSSCNI